MWYKVHQLGRAFFRVQEPGHVSFFLIKINHKAILIDSGLGIARRDFQKLLDGIGISNFDVLSTHLHCDHAGLNFQAEKVYVSGLEFEKYQSLADEEQIINYHKLLLNYKSWPDEEVKRTSDFSQKVEFINNNELIISNHEFEVLETPGHTVGHLCFVSHELKSIFLGDLIYDGMLYLNLPDSNFDHYLKSLKTILDLAEKSRYRLLPCHNSIPLNATYVRQAYEECLKIQNKLHAPTTSIEGNSIFKACDEYRIGDVKIQITSPTSEDLMRRQ